MKYSSNILFAFLVSVLLFSCFSREESKFVGTWTNNEEQEVDAVGFFEMFDTLILAEDNSFTQKLTYVDSYNTDTVASVVVNGNWQLNDSCLEMQYATDTIIVKCDNPELYAAFYNDMVGKINYANEELFNAHNQGRKFGIQNVMANEKTITTRAITPDQRPIEIYFRAN